MINKGKFNINILSSLKDEDVKVDKLIERIKKLSQTQLKDLLLLLDIE